MDVEKIGPQGPQPTDKKGKKISHDSKEFEDFLKTDKVGESEFEGKRKRKYKSTEERKSDVQQHQPPTSQKGQLPSPNEAFRQSKGPGTSSSSSSSYQGQGSYSDNSGISEPSQPQTPEEVQKAEKAKKKKAEEEKKIKKEEVTPIKKEVVKKATTPIEQKEEIDKLKKAKAKKPGFETTQDQKEKPITAPETTGKSKEIQVPIEKTKDEEKTSKKTQVPLKPSEEKEIKPKEIVTSARPSEKGPDKDKDKEEKASSQIDTKAQISATLQEFPPAIAAEAHGVTSTITPFLHSDIVPLFEKMVGTMIQMSSQGVSTTEVLLNSPAFASSVFFGSKVTLEQYSTAPNSFNIKLSGPDQAVTIMNDNLGSLIDAFRKGNFSFKINRLETEYEKPLFKRKEKTSGDGGADSGSSQ